MHDAQPLPFLGNPNLLTPFKRKPHSLNAGTAAPGEELLQVVIETPRGSRNKYSFDEDDRVFRLTAVLPAGMLFPFDFGFIPQTIGGDGDPVDVLLLTDEPLFPGCVLLARVLGIMETEQVVDGKTERNDRVLAAAEATHTYSLLRQFDQLPARTLTELEHFFSNYHRLQGKQSRLLRWGNAADALRLIHEGIERKKQHGSQAPFSAIP